MIDPVIICALDVVEPSHTLILFPYDWKYLFYASLHIIYAFILNLLHSNNYSTLSFLPGPAYCIVIIIPTQFGFTKNFKH